MDPVPSPDGSTRDTRRCTVVMVAQDEASRIGPTLEAISRNGFPIVVVDGGSEDATPEIAASFGATVLHRPFDNMSAQQNWAASHAGTDYILVLDADEIMSDELAADVCTAMDDGVDGAWVQSIDYFAGRWLAHYPQRHLRLYRRGAGHFENDVHQRFVFDVPDPRVVDLAGPIAHPSHLDVHGFIEKLNRYTEREQARDLGRATPSRAVCRAIAEGGASFAKWYVLEQGWRDGRHGFIHSVYLGVYRFTMWAKAATADASEPPTSDAAFRAWYARRRR